MGNKSRAVYAEDVPGISAPSFQAREVPDLISLTLAHGLHKIRKTSREGGDRGENLYRKTE
jgi:hypothetical protein